MFVINLEICTECVQVIVNAEGEAWRSEMIAEEFPPTEWVITVDDAEEEPFFSSLNCQTCEDLPGDRVKATASQI